MGQLVVFSQPATEPVSVAEVMGYCRIDTGNTEPAPGVITVALASPAVPGSVTAGAHRYLATFVTADGETQAGEISAAVTVSDAAVNGKIELTAIPLGGALVTSRKIYRTQASGTTYLLLVTISNNTATVYTDNIADASLGAQAPTTNTTSDPLLRMLITTARQKAEVMLNRKIITQTVDLYLDNFPFWELPVPVMQSVTSIIYTDVNGAEQTLSSGDYLVDSNSQPARITPAYGLVWPSTRYQTNAVRVRFLAGYGVASAVPDCIKSWMLMRIKQNYDQRDAVNVGSVVNEFPHSYVDGVLDPERVVSYV